MLLNQPRAGSDADRMAAGIEATTTDVDVWLDGRDSWLRDGVAHGYVASEVCCGTHDGVRLTAAEEDQFDDGDDPCVPIVRLADGPGEPLLPRFGPRPGEDKEQEP